MILLKKNTYNFTSKKKLINTHLIIFSLFLFLSFQTLSSQFSNVYHMNAGAGDGYIPQCALVYDGTYLYGTNNNDFGPNAAGTIFRVKPDGTSFSVLHAFTGTDGKNPTGSLTLVGSELYGVANGGTNNNGVLFKINTDGSGYVILMHFNSATTGRGPISGLIIIGSTIFGTTVQGGSADLGILYKVNTDGTNYTILHTFTGFASDGALPSNIIVSGNMIYGTTILGGANFSNSGTIFSVDTNGNNYSLLIDFQTESPDVGTVPKFQLKLIGSKLYGITSQGLTNNFGSLFRLNTDGSGLELLIESGTNNYLITNFIENSRIFIITTTTNPFTLYNNEYQLYWIDFDKSINYLLHEFNPGGSIAAADVPYGDPLVLNGAIYGVTSHGGDIVGDVYKLILPHTPTLTTTNASSISTTSAVSGGTITDDGASTIYSKGLVWSSTNTNPTLLSCEGSANSGSGTANFSQTMHGLCPGTVYYVRSYAINLVDTGYGSAVSFTTTASSGDIWVQKANFGGGNWDVATSFVIDNKAYIATGRNGAASNQVWEYNVYNDVWTQKANFGGVARLGAFASTVNSKGYVGGGHDGTSFVTDFWEYNPTLNTWSAKTSFPGLGRYTSAVSANNKIYTGLGQGAAIYGDWYEYDPNSDTWSTKTNFTPGVRRTPFISSINNRIFVGLGQDGSNFKSDIWEYDISGNSWIQKNDFPGLQREVFQSMSINNKGYVLGGELQSGLNTNDTWEYDLNTDLWTQKTNMPGLGRRLHSVFSVFEKGYFALGNAGGIQNDLYEYTPSTIAQFISTYSNLGVNGADISSVLDANFNGCITNANTDHGLVWHTSTAPTTTTNTGSYSAGAGNGTITNTINSLAEGTTYYVRSYSTNSLGTVYGNEVSFTTLVSPTVTSTVASSVVGYTAQAGGNVTSNGSNVVSAKGMVWSTSPNPTISVHNGGGITNDGTSTGVYTSNLTGLSLNTTYYYRAYATSSANTSYGAEYSFTTLNLPTVLTTFVSEVKGRTAQSGGTIIDDGNSAITNKGVVWSKQENPTINLTTILDEGSGIATFTSSITRLEYGKKYYLRAYATNSVGTSYGSQEEFTTLDSATEQAQRIMISELSNSSVDLTSYRNNRLPVSTKDNVLLGFKLKSGLSISLTRIKFQLNDNSQNQFKNFRLYISDDADFDTQSDNSLLATIASASTELDFSSFDPQGADPIRSLYFYLLADVNDSVEYQSNGVKFTLRSSDITISQSTIDSSQINSSTYYFQQTFSLSNNPIGVETSPIYPNSKDFAIMGFKFIPKTSNASLKSFILNFKNNPSQTLSRTLKLYSSTDNNYLTFTDNTAIALSSEVLISDQTKYTFTLASELDISSSGKYFFIIADSIAINANSASKTLYPMISSQDMYSSKCMYTNILDTIKGKEIYTDFLKVRVNSQIIPSQYILRNLNQQTVFGFSLTVENTTSLKSLIAQVEFSNGLKSVDVYNYIFAQDKNNNGLLDNGEEIARSRLNPESNLNFTNFFNNVSLSNTKQFIIVCDVGSNAELGGKLKVRIKSNDLIGLASPAIVWSAAPYEGNIQTVKAKKVAKYLKLSTISTNPIESGKSFTISVQLLDEDNNPTSTFYNVNYSIRASSNVTLSGTNTGKILIGQSYQTVSGVILTNSLGTSGVSLEANENGSLVEIIKENLTVLGTVASVQGNSLSLKSGSDPQHSILMDNWVNGNGDGRIIVMRQGEVPEDPVQGTNYSASTDLSDKTLLDSSLIGTDSYVVYNGNQAANPVQISGLNAGSIYYFKIFEYNILSNSTYYLNNTNDNVYVNSTDELLIANNTSINTAEGIQTDVISGTLENPSDTRWYKIYIGNNKNILLNLCGKVKYIELYKEENSLLRLIRTSSNTGSNCFNMILNTPSIGYYYFKVYQTNGQANTADFRFKTRLLDNLIMSQIDCDCP